MDLGAATNPWGTPAFMGAGSSLANADGASIATSFVSLGSPLGDSLSQSLNQQEVTAFDRLVAPFWFEAGNFHPWGLPFHHGRSPRDSRHRLPKTPGLASQGSGAFGQLSGEALFLSAGLDTRFGDWQLAAQGEIGQVTPAVSQSRFIDNISSLSTRAFRLAASRPFANVQRSALLPLPALKSLLKSLGER